MWLCLNHVQLDCLVNNFSRIMENIIGPLTDDQ